MSKKINLKVLFMCGVMSLVSIFSFSNVAKADNTKVTFDVQPTIVSVEIPMTASVVYDPNIEDGFVASDLIFTSNTVAPVKLSIGSITSLDAPFTENILPNGLPEGKTWETLDKIDSLKYIAFGIAAPEAVADGYSLVMLENDLYTKELTDLAASVDIGVVNPKESCNVNLIGTLGRAFKTTQNFEYQIVFEVELY